MVVTLAGDGTAANGTYRDLQLTRWNSDLTYDEGTPPAPPAGGGGADPGGSGCAEDYAETRLASNGQMDALCQAAYIYDCSGHAQGVQTACTSLGAYGADAECRYCD